MNRLNKTTSRNKGFTLTELLVTITVLLMILVGFARILKVTKDATSTAHQYMAMDNNSAAIDNIIRKDLLQYSSLGALKLSNNVLTFVTASPSVSIQNSAIKGLGSVISYGFTEINPGTSTEQKARYKNLQALYRMKIILTDTGSAEDSVGTPINKLQFSSTDHVASISSQKQNQLIQGKPLLIFPTKLSELDQNGWLCLTFKVAKPSYSPEMANAKYKAKIDMKYYNTNGTLSSWVTSYSSTDSAHKNHVPALVRFTYTLADPTLPAGRQERLYELIVQLN